MKPRTDGPISLARKVLALAGARKSGCNVLTAGGLKRVRCNAAEGRAGVSTLFNFLTNVRVQNAARLEGQQVSAPDENSNWKKNPKHAARLERGQVSAHVRFVPWNETDVTFSCGEA